MRSGTKILLLLFATLSATHAVAAQPCNQPGQFCHIIIVIQENRSVDNLFGADPTFESGVDIATGGYGIFVQNGQAYHQFIQNAPGGLNGCVTEGTVQICIDPGHEQPDWVTDYDDGNQDGFCHQTGQSGLCPEYSYVPQSEVQPSFQIGEQYGFANYFFQANEGPSYEAHQFLFSGTSAAGGPYGREESGYGNGTVFELSFANGRWKKTDLYDFPKCSEGCNPGFQMVFDKAGNLYGTASGGLAACDGYECGVVFKLWPQKNGKWKYSVVHKLTGPEGEDPWGLAIDSNGNLYGTTFMFGKYNAGTAFEITP